MPRFTNPLYVYGGCCLSWLMYTAPHSVSTFVYGSLNKHNPVWEAEAARRAAQEE